MKIEQTMKKLFLFLVASSFLFFAGYTFFAPHGKTEKNNPQAAQALLKLPVSFIENQGQIDSRFPFYAQGMGYQFLFSKNGITYAFPGKQAVIQMTFLGANSPTSIEGDKEQEGKINYLVGKDQSQWKTNIPTYGKIVYRNLYPGIDYQVEGKVGVLESEFHVAPHGDVGRIRLSYPSGFESLSLGNNGNLIIQGKNGNLIEKKPYVYQEIEGKKVERASRYWVKGKEYGYVIASYDPKKELVIDPSLTYSTYLGGSSSDYAYALAVDSSGNTYVAGFTSSTNFPTTTEAFRQPEEDPTMMPL